MSTKTTRNVLKTHFILRQVKKVAIKGTWSHFSLHLVSTKMKQKVLKTLFMVVTSMKKELNETQVYFVIV